MPKQRLMHCLGIFENGEGCTECVYFTSCTQKTKMEMAKIANSYLKELEQYRSIGTFDECREAMEKQRQKKPVKDGYGHDCCPGCGWIVYTEEYGGRYLTHCENCGQTIDWSDND